MNPPTETTLAARAARGVDNAQAPPEPASRSAFENALSRAEQSLAELPDTDAVDVAAVIGGALNALRGAGAHPQKLIDDGETGVPLHGQAPAAGPRELAIPQPSPPAAVSPIFDAAMARAMALGGDPSQLQRWVVVLPGTAVSAQLSAAGNAPWTLRLSGRGSEREALHDSLGTLRARLAARSAQVGTISIVDTEDGHL